MDIVLRRTITLIKTAAAGSAYGPPAVPATSAAIITASEASASWSRCRKALLTLMFLATVVPKQENANEIRYERDAGGDQHHWNARRLRMKESSHRLTSDENGDGNQGG